MKNVYDSFEQYIAVETMSGDNKYDAGEHGLQDAHKGCFFQSLPPVLELHLKRFVYDFQRDRNFKINDRYEFPATLNLRKYLSSDADVSVKPLYRLYGVLVHSGDVHGGHYYAYIRPTTKMQWFKFDDERVTKAKKKDVFEENFGGEVSRTYRNALGKPITTTYAKSANAYMLLYIRDSEREQILHPVEHAEIPSHLHERFEQEQAEKAAKKKEQAEAHLYVRLKVAVLADLEQWNSNDLCDFDQVRSFKVKKASSLKEFKLLAEDAFKIPIARQRYWSCPNRRNRTVRPDEPISPRDEEAPLEKFCKRNVPDIKLFLEASTAPADVTDEKLLFAPHTPEDAIVFFKYYDPDAETLRFLAYLFVKVKDKISSVASELNKRLGFPEDTELQYYEEVKPTMVDLLDPNNTFTGAELGNGDIICVQKPPAPDKTYRRPQASAFYTYMLNRVNVRFRELENPSTDVFVLELAKDMSYDDVVSRLAQNLETDPTKIRLTQHGCMYNKPRMQPLRSTVKQTLTEMLANPYSQKKTLSDILYYEKLDIPIQELENNKLLKIDWYNSKIQLEKSHSILVGKNALFADVIAKLKEVVELKGTQEIRLLEVHNSKIYRLLKPDERTTGYTEYTTLRAEEVPEDELQKEKGSKRIQVVHIWRDPPMTYPFGNPFYLVVPKSEKFGETKKRIQQKLEVSDEQFATWKFSIVQWIGKPIPIEDDEVQIATKLDGMDCLGLEHKMPRRANPYRRKEEQLVIKG
jgi:ubiquitin carboxyl-terminal hydrolase 7